MHTNSYQQLDSEKYWNPIHDKEARLLRKIERHRRASRLILFFCFVAGATLGYLYFSGQLENVDLAGRTQQVRNFFGY